jgi:putative toxin-antitoxin system antitoxin component (TIGR02293 family)
MIGMANVESAGSSAGRGNAGHRELSAHKGETTPRRAKSGRSGRGSVGQRVIEALKAQSGIAKEDAASLFKQVAAAGSMPMGTVRAELIPDSSWKRAGTTLGPQASQTAARLGYILSFAERVWGNASDAAEWLMSPHAELRGASPFSMLKTEAGGRAVEALLGALEFGFPV